ncbi:ABC transporter substrate-binding protein [Pedobacter metabolipauper]|uniref:ABC-type branched-subunit amino acid transport system substrate-binding protein n=1 Tax=Pedobacter metabolipauper TaxID=425513 RepID=A0A4R6SQX9_9SPHI|nr:ABC transporter substrate-binding protein [Pedobacter metabolipauper]TDQ07370.1 ABC-type branched-subunit amino acid transport system substrate-binding protein [Pedobacter metabolipauper]
MILALNHQPQLSGNKHWLIICLGLFLASCSPKINTNVKKPDIPKSVEKETVKPDVKFTQATISLLVPFKLNEIRLKTATRAEVEKAAMAIDFYQGFKLGVDSAAALGLNFKLKVYDTRDENAQIDGLIQNGSLLGSDLIIGPVFPQGLKHITSYSLSKGIPVVSPLAASHPAEFKNPNLISLVSNVDLHAQKIGDYINKHYNPAQTVVVLINPKSASDELMAKPLRTYFANPSRKFLLQEFGSVFTMETKLIRNKKYVIIVCSDDQKFVVPTLDKLVKMKNAGLAVDLYGHPGWIKQNYNTDKLQALNTAVTSSYKVDYTRSTVKTFIIKYRAAYHFEPGEYAFKGFDTGFYFAKLLAEHGLDYLKYMERERYNGLQNDFSFRKDPELGYINTSLMLLKYQDFTLKNME